MKEIQKLLLRSDVDLAGGGYVEDDPDYEWDANGDLIPKGQKPDGPSAEEIAEKTRIEEEAKASSLVDKALSAMEERAQAKKKAEEDAKRAEIEARQQSTVDPDQDLLDQIALSTNPVDIAKINREIVRRERSRSEEAAVRRTSVLDDVASEFAGGDEDLARFLKSEALSGLSKDALDYVKKTPSERRKIELIAKGYMAERGDSAPAIAPRSEGSRQRVNQTKWSDEDNREIEKYMRSCARLGPAYVVTRAQAEEELKDALRGNF